MSFLHVGITVVPTRSDFFYFLKHWISQDPARSSMHEFESLSLPVPLMETVRKVEYSPRWMIRASYYGPIIAWLDEALLALATRARTQKKSVILYLPDDGYWAELFTDICSKKKLPFRILYVQHGMASLEPASRLSRTIRTTANALSRLATGYSSYGYGFGSGRIDGYIVTFPEESDYITRHFGTRTYTAPWFIRTKLLEEAARRAAAAKPRQKIRIVFAMSPLYSRQIDLFGSASKKQRRYFRDVADCLNIIWETVDCEIWVRFHPNDDHDAVTREFQRSGMGRFAQIDACADPLDSLVSNDFIVSYASTFLAEAALIGRVPVNFIPRAYPPQDMVFPNEALRFHRDVGGHAIIETDRRSLAALFSQETMAEYRARAIATPNYKRAIPWLE